MGSGTIRLGGLFGVVSAATAGLAVLGMLPALHTWVGLPGAYSMVIWLALTGLVMLAIPPIVVVESVGV